MRLSLSLLIASAWMTVPIARAQTAATQPVETQPDTAPPAAVQTAADAVRPSRPSPLRHPRPVRGSAQRSVTVGKSAGVDLGATDITGNKELPKVMVIVPWKDSLGAGGVVKPTDSLLDQVLQPVDRGVFQREIHYYGQLNAGEARPAAATPENRARKPGVPQETVAPVGDSH